MKKRYIFILFVYFFFNSYLNAQIELTHNVGNEVINTGMFSCPEPEYFARTFTLQDFGIALGSEFETLDSYLLNGNISQHLLNSLY